MGRVLFDGAALQKQTRWHDRDIVCVQDTGLVLCCWVVSVHSPVQTPNATQKMSSATWRWPKWRQHRDSRPSELCHPIAGGKPASKTACSEMFINNMWSLSWIFMHEDLGWKHRSLWWSWSKPEMEGEVRLDGPRAAPPSPPTLCSPLSLSSGPGQA